jgi:hypothetical protein
MPVLDHETLAEIVERDFEEYTQFLELITALFVNVALRRDHAGYVYIIKCIDQIASQCEKEMHGTLQ